MTEQREQELILAPNEFALISDRTKGNISAHVGPSKSTLSTTDNLVYFNADTKRFETCNLGKAVQKFCTAPEGWYVILKNPSRDNEQPKIGGISSLTDYQLVIGRKVNMPGPVSFPLWPGQMSKVIQGHRMRSNQYLVVRVYDDERARASWKDAIIKSQNPGASGDDDNNDVVKPDAEVPELTMGKLLVIKGTDVSFYIPPTGIEVVHSIDNASLIRNSPQEEYVRNAVTLERLEYCILLDEDGNKRFVRGPDVVFPRPTEEFITRNGQRKFKAIELTGLMGLYVKVIADYEENSTKYTAGEEQFITGETTKIYYPRPEHAVIKYGSGEEVHFASAIPEGEGRYVLDRERGTVDLIKGPQMFLPDPRKQVIVQRILDPKLVKLLYPGNNEALLHNEALARTAKQEKDAYNQYLAMVDSYKNLNLDTPTDDSAPPTVMAAAAMTGDSVYGMSAKSLGYESFTDAMGVHVGTSGARGMTLGGPPKSIALDKLNRREGFTPPRTITLDTKFEGAVIIDLWTGYAMQIVSKDGTRRVVEGPQPVMLAYDETPEKVILSTGKPKTTNKIKETVYLRVRNNKVADIIYVETKDLVRASIKVSYRVNFEGESDQWFSVENYVKYLCDHMRSLLINAVRRVGIEEFYSDPIKTIRDTVLGKATEDGKRVGRLFEENGMRVYDVEVLNVTLENPKIANLLTENQHRVVTDALQIAQRERELDITKRSEVIVREGMVVRAETNTKAAKLELENLVRILAVNMQKLSNATEEETAKIEAEHNNQELLDNIDLAMLERTKLHTDYELEVAKVRLTHVLTDIEARSASWVAKANAIQPDLVAALQSSADKELLTTMAEKMAPLAILGGTSVAEITNRLLKGTKLDGLLSTEKEGQGQIADKSRPRAK